MFSPLLSSWKYFEFSSWEFSGNDTTSLRLKWSARSTASNSIVFFHHLKNSSAISSDHKFMQIGWEKLILTRSTIHWSVMQFRCKSELPSWFNLMQSTCKPEWSLKRSPRQNLRVSGEKAAIRKRSLNLFFSIDIARIFPPYFSFHQWGLFSSAMQLCALR